jgi:radical SAM superfamily enzyme YgiQ (UPF0313 family)
MSWKLKKKVQSLIAGEEGAVRKDWGGRVSVALVYPNTYAVGMSNLGFQTVYERLNALPDAVCERVFFPDPEDTDEFSRTGTEPFSLESLRPLREFDIIGFSVTYEGDYINVLRLLGMAVFLCAPPTADRVIPGPHGRRVRVLQSRADGAFMDAVAVGEGEELVGEIVAAYAEVRAGSPDARGGT